MGLDFNAVLNFAIRIWEIRLARIATYTGYPKKCETDWATEIAPTAGQRFLKNRFFCETDFDPCPAHGPEIKQIPPRSLSPSIQILEPFDVFLAEFIARLHFDDADGLIAWVLEPVQRA